MCGAISCSVRLAAGPSGSARATVGRIDAARAADSTRATTAAGSAGARASRAARGRRTAGAADAIGYASAVAYTDAAARQAGSDAGAESQPKKEFANRCRFHRRDVMQEQFRPCRHSVSGAYSPKCVKNRDLEIRALNDQVSPAHSGRRRR